MKKVTHFLNISLLICSFFALSADYTGIAVSTSDSKRKACDNALLIVKKEAGDFFGVTISGETKLNIEKKGEQSSSSFNAQVQENLNQSLRVISNEIKKVTFDEESGSISCTVEATISKMAHLNAEAKKGPPDWVNNPPKEFGKIVSVAYSEQKFVALLLALVENYGEVDFDITLGDLQGVDSEKKNLGQHQVSDYTLTHLEKRVWNEGAEEQIVLLRLNAKNSERKKTIFKHYSQRNSLKNPLIKVEHNELIGKADEILEASKKILEMVREEGVDVEFATKQVNNKTMYFCKIVSSPRPKEATIFIENVVPDK